MLAITKYDDEAQSHLGTMLADTETFWFGDDELMIMKSMTKKGFCCLRVSNENNAEKWNHPKLAGLVYHMWTVSNFDTNFTIQ